jgi:hypothetical protein
MTFWRGSGSGSADPCLWQIDPDSDSAIFVIDLQNANCKLIFFKVFLRISYRFGAEAGSKPLTNGSGSRRPKNMRIRRIRIRIRNTVFQIISKLLSYLNIPCAKIAIFTGFHAPGKAVSSPENPNGLEKYFWSSWFRIQGPNWILIRCETLIKRASSKGSARKLHAIRYQDSLRH